MQLGLQHHLGDSSTRYFATLISPWVQLRLLDLFPVLLSSQNKPDGRLLFRLEKVAVVPMGQISR